MNVDNDIERRYSLITQERGLDICSLNETKLDGKGGEWFESHKDLDSEVKKGNLS